jgi:hypothetical protein
MKVVTDVCFMCMQECKKPPVVSDHIINTKCLNHEKKPMTNTLGITFDD